MTVCIAAICGNSVILCSDRKVSSKYLGSAEIGNKQHFLHEKWGCLAAGNQTDINGLLVHVRERFWEHKNAKPGRIDETNITLILREAMSMRQHDKIDEFVQGKWGIAYDAFLKDGKQHFTSDVYSRTANQIETINLGAALVVAGFDPLGFPIICVTDQTGSTYLPDAIGLAGEGEHLAMAALLKRKYRSDMEFPEALYFVFEAKKYAEGVGSVGTETDISIWTGDSHPKYLSEKGIGYLEACFAKFGPQPVSSLTADDSFFR